jgi:hypothetical protein
MAVQVQYGPSMADYGAAIASASQRQTAADRAAAYSQYLSGVQQQNQQFALGLGNLDVNRGQLGLEGSKLSFQQQQAKFANQLAIAELDLQRRISQDENKARLMGASAALNNSYGAILSAMLSGGYR